MMNLSPWIVVACNYGAFCSTTHLCITWHNCREAEADFYGQKTLAQSSHKTAGGEWVAWKQQSRKNCLRDHRIANLENHRSESSCWQIVEVSFSYLLPTRSWALPAGMLPACLISQQLGRVWHLAVASSVGNLYTVAWIWGHSHIQWLKCWNKEYSIL